MVGMLNWLNKLAGELTVKTSDISNKSVTNPDCMYLLYLKSERGLQELWYNPVNDVFTRLMTLLNQAKSEQLILYYSLFATFLYPFILLQKPYGIENLAIINQRVFIGVPFRGTEDDEAGTKVVTEYPNCTLYNIVQTPERRGICDFTEDEQR